MVLEDAVQRSGEKLLQRIREQSEPEIRGFIGELLTAAARERAAALDEARQHADADRERAVRDKAASVRAEAQRTLATALDEARQHADADRERAVRDETASVRAEAQRTLATALAAARDEAERVLAQRVGEVQAETERTLAALAELEETLAAAPKSEEVLGRVVDGVRRLDQASSLTDVLNALAEVAGSEAQRAGVVIVEGERIRGWRFVGFEPALLPAGQVELAIGDAGIVGEAAQSAASRSVVAGAEPGVGGSVPAFMTLPSGANAVAVPVMVGGDVSAIVYGDDGGGEPPAGWRESLEILARHAGHCLEGLTAARLVQLARLDAAGGLGADAPAPALEEPRRRPGMKAP